jgi:hypothetical protein
MLRETEMHENDWSLLAPQDLGRFNAPGTPDFSVEISDDDLDDLYQEENGGA